MYRLSVRRPFRPHIRTFLIDNSRIVLNIEVP
jgi:hypothetical protein